MLLGRHFDNCLAVEVQIGRQGVAVGANRKLLPTSELCAKTISLNYGAKLLQVLVDF